ncbi:MAG: fused MFS/spermidine synthase [Planctomycetota bacterium]
MLKNITKIEVIIFAGGAVVMIMELIGSRILAPYLGTSIFVWSSLIGIILGALSLGYYLGGRFSLKNPNFRFLGAILLFASLSVLIVPFIKEPLLQASMELGIRTGSVVSTLALFTVPSVLLGMVSPYAIRLKAKHVDKVGGVAGTLYAISTVGSITGTFLAGFVLIPCFGSTQILFGLSLVLLLISLLCGFEKKKLVCIALIAMLCVVHSRRTSPFLVDMDSAYNHIRVVDTLSPVDRAPIRVLYLATESHSVIYRNSDKLYSKYIRYYQMDKLFNPTIKKALTLGGGAYVAPMSFLDRFPQGEMTVVEIDPEVTRIAREYFLLTDDPRLAIIHEDGRIFLNSTKEKYDLIYGDAFQSYYSIPFQLTTRQAMEKAFESLNPGGVLMLNIVSSLEGEKSAFFQAEYKTLIHVFPHVYVFPLEYMHEGKLDAMQNIMIVATKQAERLTKEQLLERADEKTEEFIRHLWEKEIHLDPSIEMLTDNFAPVDYYISKLL